MNRLRLGALAALALALALPAAAEYTPYSQLRHDYASIDVAVAHMASSDINGSLNRISALFQRSAVESATEGAYTNGGPENFERGLIAAIADLREDLAEFDTSATLTNADRAALIQTIDVILYRKAYFLYRGYSNYQPCPMPDPPIADSQWCSDASSGVIAQLDGLARSLLDNMDAISADPTVCTATHDFTPPNLSRYRSSNFEGDVDTLRGLFAIGVESIDDM